ncbi:hypothetical protein CC99x_007245 [Candidatus Berkiella cookevillensis]|uniref:Uncharacterized protein n=1 Tax=Candidatus Berkiella cookevillensis TaxID=437022 RepID=A0A0Q9YN86_9GAMM|nr:hypothetical protein [Candidatus Berkiella cookevillensis]MCS5708702.1 hypothetical protein [Candidatus Berkiella cookevillensis]
MKNSKLKLGVSIGTAILAFIGALLGTYVSGYMQESLRKIDLDNPEDLSLMQRLYSDRIPISNCFGIIKETTVATLNLLYMSAYYIESMDCMVIYQIKDETLYIKDIIATKLCDLDLILNSISNKFSKVVLQFSPDNFLKIPFNPIAALTDGCFMISQDFDMKCSSFRYPETQRC